MPAPAPAAPPRRERLASINKSAFGRPKAAQRLGPVAGKKACCADPQIEEEDGMKVCLSCGTQISESNIVADITFSEDSRGAATVQGGFIGENARHARTLGAGAYRRIGGGERNTLAEIESNGRRALAALCPRLSIPDNVSSQAAMIWSLAAKNNFNAGRRTDEVVAACLYAACRRQKENTVLLMDISEMLHINVFRLGEVYKDLVRTLYLGGDPVGVQCLVEVEPLIMKYCRKLEFGDQTRQVAEDAIKIIRRMRRDWMVTGRHPAGLCGACIILAARMNNFRRSVREVVYVSKVADVTVAKRVEEFRRTRAAALTVEQFREFGARLRHQADPPSVYESNSKKQKFEAQKRKRQERNTTETESRASSLVSPVPTQEQDEENDARRKRQRTSAPLPSPAVTQRNSERAPSEAGRRFDQDGFAIPALPIDPAVLAQAVPPKRRGRPKKSDVPPPMLPTPEELEDEQVLEDEIEESLENEQIIDSRNEIERAKAEERAKLLAEQQKKLGVEQARERREAEGHTWVVDRPNHHEPANDTDPIVEVDSTSETIPSDGAALAEGAGSANGFTATGATIPARRPRPLVTDEQLELEFQNDPEVINCRLSDAEAKIKEQIWVAHNEDWLRAQHERDLLKKIAEAAGPKDKSKRGAKGKKKKRSKMGDGTLLAQSTTPIESPADANAAMLAKHAPTTFSRYVNYEILHRVYGPDTPSSSASASRAGSEVPTPGGNDTRGSPRAASVARRAPGSTSPSPPRTTASGGRPSTRPTQRAAGTPPSTQAEDTQSTARASTAQIQPQAPEGADDGDGGDEMDADGDDDDYHEDTGSQWAGFYEEDEREDIGEDDYRRATDPLGTVSFDDDAYGYDEYD